MIRRILKRRPELGLDMFETRTEAWTAAGLQMEVNSAEARRARLRLPVLVAVTVGVVVAYVQVVEHHFRLVGGYFQALYTYYAALRVGHHAVRPTNPPADWHVAQPWFQVAAVLAILTLGWLVSRDASRVAPALFKRMDPATAGTVGFLMRLGTTTATALLALVVAGISLPALAVGGAFTAVVLGLAAQQTLGNLFAGMVLLSARPFRLGERIRLQAGAVGGSVEGIVSSLGLLYTTLARGEDRILVPNSVVLAAAVVPLREPDAVDVKVRLSSGIHPTHVQAMLDENITTDTRSPPNVVLEEIDGDQVVIRVRATPDRRSEGARLADEIIAALSNVTTEHQLDADADGDGVHRSSPAG